MICNCRLIPTASDRSRPRPARIGLAALAAIVAVLPAGSALAIRHGGVTGTRLNYNNSSASTPASPSRSNSPSPNNSAVISARDEVAKLSAEKRRAFETSPELAQAKRDSVAAWIAYRDITTKVLSDVRDTQEYRAGASAIEQSESSLADLRAGAAAEGVALDAVPLATELMQRRSALRKMEDDAINANDAARKAHYAVLDADGKIIALRRQFDESLRDDPALRDARSRLDDARKSRLAVRQ